jgi:hypothetical protein
VKLCLNLLAATAGGQLSRARAFLDRFDEMAPHAQLLVIKEKSVLTEYRSTARRQVIDVPIGLGKLKAFRRMWWENFVMPRIIRKHNADVYLTFSHYLPHLFDTSLPSVVGVSNLAPFSAEAWSQESLPVKLRMAALRRTIISSALRATRVLALSETCREILIAFGIPENKITVAPIGGSPFQPATCFCVPELCGHSCSMCRTFTVIKITRALSRLTPVCRPIFKKLTSL